MEKGNTLVAVDVSVKMNKFTRFPNLSRKVMKNDLMLYREVVERQRLFVLNHAQVYKLPAALTKKNLAHYDKILSAIDLVVKSPN